MTVETRPHDRSDRALATGPMTTTDHPADAHAWLATGTMRTASDVLLGCVLLVAGAIAIWDGRGALVLPEDGMNAGFFPTAVGAAAVAVGILLLGRSALFQRPQPAPWRIRSIAIIVAVTVACVFIAWEWGLGFLLKFGPPEHAAFITLMLVIAVALARRSRHRAVGMTLLGLLLSAVGIDAITGQLRLTMGLEPLFDGFATPLVLFGLIVVGDGLICLVSPSLWLATYAWLRTPSQPALPMVVSIAARIAAALAITAACYFAFALNGRTSDIALLLLIGLFGVLCKLFGWNRLVLILGCMYGDALEQSFRQTMLLSQVDPSVFLLRPISAGLLAASLAIIALVVVLAARSSLLRRRAAPAAP